MAVTPPQPETTSPTHAAEPTVADEEPPPPEPESEEPPPPSLLRLTLRELRREPLRLAVMAIVALLGGPALILARDYARARQASRAHKKFAARRTPRERLLAAIVNGAEYILGPESSLRRVRMGRDASNSLVLTGEGVERHHAELARRNGHWLLTNLSRNPIDVNGTPVPARARQRIFLPAAVRLCPKVSVRLLLRPSTKAPGQAKQAKARRNPIGATGEPTSPAN